MWNCHRAWQNLIFLRWLAKNIIEVLISGSATKSLSKMKICPPIAIYLYISHRESRRILQTVSGRMEQGGDLGLIDFERDAGALASNATQARR
jgi:hypothetical protein